MDGTLCMASRGGSQIVGIVIVLRVDARGQIEV